MAATLQVFREQIAICSMAEELKGSIVMPENRFVRNGLGQIIAAGDGKYLRTGDTRTMWVKVGDIVMYQIGGPQEVNAKFKHEGKDIKIIHQGDCIAKLKTNMVTLDNFQVLGDWVLLKPKLEQGVIFVPQQAAQPESWRFYLQQTGDNFKLPIKIGQEVYPERGKCAPIEIEGEEFVFTHQDFIHGMSTAEPTSSLFPAPPPA